MEDLQITRVREDATLPTRSHRDDAGLDLYAAEERWVSPYDVTPVTTGVAVAIPPGYAGLVWPRSGLAMGGVQVYAGVVDAGYRGELQVALHSLRGHTIHVGDKIAQLLIQPVELPMLRLVDELPSANRGDKGFGSTGK